MIESTREKTRLPFAGDRNRKQAFEEWNSQRNRAKRHSKGVEEFVTMNFFDAAYEMIQRANADGEKLNLFASNRQEYENWLVLNVYS